MSGVIACFGEVLLRYSPPAPLQVEQASQFNICTGGAEANVAVGLARLGHATRMLTVLPDNALGNRALSEIASHGVDTSALLRAEGRMGSYIFTPPSGVRPGGVIYDREHSAFAQFTPSQISIDDWLEGVSHLHLSGVTLALSAELALLTLTLAKAARARGATVSFDGNFRATLWARSGREPSQTIASLFSVADIAFANHKDASLLLGREISGDGPVRRREAALALFEAFPNLTAIASTARHIEDVSTHGIAARIDTPDAEFQTAEQRLTNIVDRIGTGDAFAAGVLHAWLSDREDLAAAAHSGMAMAALKHATWGDFPLTDRGELSALIGGQSDVVR